MNCGNIFLDPCPKAKKMKAKINKQDLIKFKNSCIAKETINKTKRQPMEPGENIYNNVTDRVSISKIYKQHIQLNIKKANDPIKKWAENMNIHFSKEDIQMANRHKKGYVVGITSHQSEGLLSKSTNNNWWKGCGEQGTLLHC